MAEPERLARGKWFQAIVQADFRDNTRDGVAHAEAYIPFDELPEIRQKSGRADILITELGDMVTILEIKATDWDRIKPTNVKRNLSRHQRQLFKYVNKYYKIDGLQVCIGIIYPEPPQKPGLREFIESYLEETCGAPAYWYTEIGSSEAG